jgi:predicted glutamine amidotransferase
MCRMVGVVGRVPQEEVLALRRLAADGAVPGDPPGHADGWGVVVGPGLAYAGRSAGSAATEPAFVRAAASAQGAPLAVAHVRKASLGAVDVANAHPFVADGLAFCHNGTVHGIAAAGQSDSRAYFQRVLDGVRTGLPPKEAFVAAARSLDPGDYSSITALLTDGRSLWGLRKVGRRTQDCGGRECALGFYTLGVVRRGDATVVAQEHALAGSAEWTAVPDGGLVEVRPDGRFQVSRVL